MKKSCSASRKHGPEFKGVVKKISGKLTNRPDVEAQGLAEMRATRLVGASKRSIPRTRLNPDSHRRG